MTTSQRDANFIMPLLLKLASLLSKNSESQFSQDSLVATSDYQARSPWTEIGGKHLVRDPDYTVDAKQPPIRAPGASVSSPKMCVTWRCPNGRQFGLCPAAHSG